MAIDLSMLIDDSMRGVSYATKGRVRDHIRRRVATLNFDLVAWDWGIAFAGDLSIQDPKVKTLLDYCDRYNIAASYCKRPDPTISVPQV